MRHSQTLSLLMFHRNSTYSCTACARVLTACALVQRYKIPVMDFDQFMGNVKATGAKPYLVLNYDSCNIINGPGDWSFNQLLELAKSWIAYIIRMGYQVWVCRRCTCA